MKKSVETLIRVQAECQSGKVMRPVGYLDDMEEKKRRILIKNLEAIVDYEKKRLTKA